VIKVKLIGVEHSDGTYAIEALEDAANRFLEKLPPNTKVLDIKLALSNGNPPYHYWLTTLAIIYETQD